MSSAWKIAMAGPDRKPALLRIGWIPLWAVLPLMGCGSSMPKSLEAPAGTTESAPVPPTSSTPESTVTVVDEDLEPAPEAEVEAEVESVESPAPVTPDPEPQADDESLVMIDTGAKDLTEKPRTLVDAARAERQRRQIADPTDIVITDESLAEYATGELTIAEPIAPQEGAGPDGGETSLQEAAEREAYWRGRSREIRQAWRDAYDRIPELEEKVFQLRQEQLERRDVELFYRDGEIKPAWDRAIEQLEESRLEVEARQEELAQFLEEGREAGALPGWLREGIDLEPEPLVEAEPTAEPSEPVIYQQEATDPP